MVFESPWRCWLCPLSLDPHSSTMGWVCIPHWRMTTGRQGLALGTERRFLHLPRAGR